MFANHHADLDGVQRKAYYNTMYKPNTAKIVGALLASDDPNDRSLAVTRLREIIEAANGQLLTAARLSGISHRSLCRWQEIYPEVRNMISEVRNAKQILGG